MRRESADPIDRCSTQRSVDLSLVVPVHHRAGDLSSRLRELRSFSDSLGSAELILVDDCGTDADASGVLERFAEQAGTRLLRNDRNRGKGYSVARGMLAACGRYRVFTDADLAYPLTEIDKIMSVLARGADVAIACRVLPDSQYVMNASYVRYIYTRHVLSRAFNTVVRATLVPGVLDTQAGLKGFTAAAAEQLFSRLTIDGFGFDVECLYLARRLRLRVEQVAVRYRYDDEPSTVRFVRDARIMAGDLVRIAWRGARDTYGVRRIPRGSQDRAT